MRTTGVLQPTSQACVSQAELEARARVLGQVLRELVTATAPGVVLLDGPMGAGKTTFTRALAGGLGVTRPERVCSPTFLLCMQHPGRTVQGSALTLVHVDLFRLADEEGDAGMGEIAGFDALDLDLDEVPGAHVLVVEWARKWSEPPSDHLAVALAMADEAREMRITARGGHSAAILQEFDRRVAGVLSSSL